MAAPRPASTRAASTADPTARSRGRSEEAGPGARFARLCGVTVTDYADTWVVLPTYNEKDNLPGIAAAILAALPGATLLVVDDDSPDGTGAIADEMAAADPQSWPPRRRAAAAVRPPPSCQCAARCSAAHLGPGETR